MGKRQELGRDEFKTYLQVTRDVGSGQDASCSGKEDGKDGEEILAAAEIRRKVLDKDFGFEEETQEFEDVSSLTF